jgi:hypothetical protein
MGGHLVGASNAAKQDGILIKDGAGGTSDAMEGEE